MAAVYFKEVSCRIEKEWSGKLEADISRQMDVLNMHGPEKNECMF